MTRPLRALPSLRGTQRMRLGTLPFDILADGRVQVTLPPTAVAFGVAMRATVLYPSLRAFLTATLTIHRSGTGILGGGWR